MNAPLTPALDPARDVLPAPRPEVAAGPDAAQRAAM